MHCTHSPTTATFPSLSSYHHPFKALISKRHHFSPSYSTLIPHLSLTHKTLRPTIRCTASDGAGAADTGDWHKWLPKNFFAPEKVLKSISGATSSPICQYISSPSTFLHSVDPRIKLAWLVTLVIVPARAHILMRGGLVVYLALLSVWILPRRVWMDQLGRVALLSGILFIMLGLGADGVPPAVQSRTPPPSLMGLPNLPASLEGYSYLIMKFGPLQLTRKGLSVATTSASLTFTIFQSASLCLATTTPEQLAFALQWFLLPLAHFGAPVAEVILTLLLSLRFINMVFDEVRIVALGIVSRRINWQQLTVVETIDIFFTYIRRIFKNLFGHAEQITQAMNVRGFRGDSKSHKIYFSSESSTPMANIVSLSCLVGLMGAAAFSEYVLV
ncbi:hypothetical protein RJ639_011821 [Escallonia herrerae]|uniref:Cobalt transport protein n=1 Tax=Escallonia herrerae TaxID=1293975 RepID=A0AA88VKJ2_9ASTE|nr:hypothetical protein RJ639_011821 [Escallonia herrerae]